MSGVMPSPLHQSEQGEHTRGPYIDGLVMDSDAKCMWCARC